ncbi:MAG: hypothetical protein VB122_03310 [Erysipelotrichales bacterium]|jgi:hypothetical protein|nr:hypothetical protein [Dysgonamonadaceae bacterium]MDD3309900.1 hypothetical protein [Dysgonamonadaceae bacterium]MDD3901545.1 hypothetical protein [Dysgonamonadaceae bacterium]MDD4399990.1 hypothetical protein [Dysgonamonadaceae bacterium]MEA4821253.1 hypothetical protein [Erysipelotrichales bacterium]
MTHFEKLDKLLNGLMSRIRIRLERNIDDKRLTFDFLCDALFKNEGVEDWEKKFLQNRLISDGYIAFEKFYDEPLPIITQKGIEFVQKGGYKKIKEKETLYEEVQISTIKSNNRSKWALIVSIVSVILTLIINILVLLLKK